MARRRVRLDVAGCYFHVTARGTNRQTIFLERADYQFYLAHLKLLLFSAGVELHAYCLMPNHIHLLLKTLRAGLSRLIEQHHGWYARRFNWKYKRCGAVFQRPFGAKLVIDDAYLMEVIRYIHMNPVKDMLVPRPELYPWSSIHAYLAATPDGLVKTDALREFFDTDTNEFYRFTVARHDIKADPMGWPMAPWYKDSHVSFQTQLEVPEAGALLKQVAEAYGVPIQALTDRWAGDVGEARAAAMLLMRLRTDWSVREIAAVMKVKAANAVSNRMRWLRKLAAQDAAVRSRLEKLGLLGEIGVLGVKEGAVQT